jgi:hypothetical protein
MDDVGAARTAKAERMAKQIVKIADDATGDVVVKPDPKGGEKGDTKVVVNRDTIARAKLRIETRMWLMARLAPHIYGSAAPKTVETDPPMSYVIHTYPEPALDPTLEPDETVEP